MSQKLPVNHFKWIIETSQFDEDFIKNYNKERDEGYFLQINVQYREKLHELHNDLQFLSERMELEKIKKFTSLTNLHDKNEDVIHIRNLKQALNHGLIFNKKDWLKPYIDTNTELRQKAKNRFFQVNEYWKTMENVIKHRDIKKLATTERRRNYLVSEPNCCTAKFLTENLLAIEI